jgi:hypothetical protein
MRLEQHRSVCCPRVLARLGAAAIMLSLCFGCSSSNRANMRSGYARVVTPLPPAFLTSAAAFLLTNNQGFSARVEVQSESSLGEKTSDGELLSRGDHIFYIPNEGELTDTHRRPGGYSFIWNVVEHRGFVLSEALQGYAPVNSALQVTNLQIIAGTVSAERIAGHPCESARAVAASNEGASSVFDFFRAVDLHGLTLRVVTVTNTPAFTLTLSKIRLEAPAASIFLPPDGFTKYPNAEAMADELAARQHNLRRKSSPQLEQLLDQQRRY